MTEPAANYRIIIGLSHNMSLVIICRWKETAPRQMMAQLFGRDKTTADPTVVAATTPVVNECRHR